VRREEEEIQRGAGHCDPARDVSQVRKLKVLEDENGRLNRLLADAMLDNAVLKEVTSKLVEPAAERKTVEHVDRSSRSACVGHDERVGNMPMAEITRAHVIAIKNKLVEEGQSLKHQRETQPDTNVAAMGCR